jgi:lysine 6-dehydrogenase
MDLTPVKTWGHGLAVPPRELLEAVLTERLTDPDEDVVLVRVEAGGRHGGQWVRHIFELVDHAHPDTHHTAMMRTTGYPAAIIAGMLGRGEIADHGAVVQELAVPGEKFLGELRARGLEVTEREEAGPWARRRGGGRGAGRRSSPARPVASGARSRSGSPPMASG